MNFFTERVLEHRPRRPREVVEAPRGDGCGTEGHGLVVGLTRSG